MRVAEQRDAIGRQIDDGLDRAREALFVLLRKAVDDVDVDIGEALFARAIDEPLCLDRRLMPANRVLNRLREILHADAHRREAAVAKRAELTRSGPARIELDA